MESGSPIAGGAAESPSESAALVPATSVVEAEAASEEEAGAAVDGAADIVTTESSGWFDNKIFRHSRNRIRF